jgi:TonB family protein
VTVESSTTSMPAPARRPSDDPVPAERDRAETKPQPAIFSSYVKPQKSKKGHGLLIAALLLALGGGGFYAAWMYQPGFRGLVEVQLGRVMALAGTANQLMGSGAHPQTASRPPVKASTPQRPPAVPPAPASTAGPVSTDTSRAARPPAESIAPPAMAATAAPEKAGLAGENDVVILSSKGAERRLLLRVPPAYSPEVRSQGIEGTVVLKTMVSESGTVEGVSLVAGNPAMAEPAISAVKQWRYKPYLRDGKAKPFQTIVLVDVP